MTPDGWLESDEGREAIERGAEGAFVFTAERQSMAWRGREWPTLPKANRDIFVGLASAVLASALSDRLCDTCGGEGLVMGWKPMRTGGEMRSEQPCPDCVGGRRPSVLVPRGEQQ